MAPFAHRTFEWGVVIATFLSVLTIVPRHCAHVTYFVHPKSRKTNAVLITPQLMTLTCGAPAVRRRRAGSIPRARQHNSWHAIARTSLYRRHAVPGQVARWANRMANTVAVAPRELMRRWWSSLRPLHGSTHGPAPGHALRSATRSVPLICPTTAASTGAASAAGRPHSAGHRRLTGHWARECVRAPTNLRTANTRTGPSPAAGWGGASTASSAHVGGVAVGGAVRMRRPLRVRRSTARAPFTYRGRLSCTISNCASAARSFGKCWALSFEMAYQTKRRLMSLQNPCRSNVPMAEERTKGKKDGSVASRGHPGGGGGIPCVRGGEYESTNSGATKSVPLLKNERTNYVWFPIIAHEKQWAPAMPNVHPHKSLKTPNKLRTNISYRI